MNKLFGPLWALIAGGLLPLAFAPQEWWPLAILSPLLLFLVWDKSTARIAALEGFVYGLGAFGMGVSWVYISIHTYGDTSALLAGIITGGFVMILSLFPALTGYLFKRFFHSQKNPLRAWLLAMPSLWALGEWLRSWIFSGFPWLLLGQSQTASPLAGFAPLAGVYGLSFLVILSASLLFILIKAIYPAKHFRKILSGLLGFIFIWLMGFLLAAVPWTKINTSAIKVALVQGNISQSIKWSPDEAVKSLMLYENLSRDHWDSQIIVWPENAVTLLLPDALNLLVDFDKTAYAHKTALITGIPIPDADNVHKNQNIYYNGVIVLGNGSGHYFKRHLVPFGEYVPLEKLLRGVIGFFDLPMSGFTAGPRMQALLDVNDIAVAPFVCYEIAYTNLLRSDLPEAQLLVTVSNDSWFDQSSALFQHRQIAQMAAEITGRYMLVATNSGQTVIISPKGKLLATAPLGESVVLTGQVYGMTGATPWVTLGNTPFIILFIVLLFISVWRTHRQMVKEK